MSEEIKNEQTVPETEETARSVQEDQETIPNAEPEAPDASETADGEPAEQAVPDPEIEALRKALGDAEKQRDDYLALAQRAQADYQNFKRRTTAVRTEAYDDGVRETIAALLPVVDNLERAIAAADSSADALVSGVQMTLKQLLESMTKLGLEEVPALGEKFDPDIHNAVMRAPEGEGEPGMVLEVFQKGYRVKGRMIRYAMVKIAAEN